ncbi:histone-lysine N-methyltransferase SETMAR-like [Homalodisca vitripennis]|uniref:histone-lysine N-methyltransferase SETMAR-like n=1 Tax=Homalodisca vitripennis TaxID=197043 RepID=UPI001EE9C5DC|nr:histone-lysine N-methyltransferase SETMAR-like [Homalodisca vitripennis]
MDELTFMMKGAKDEKPGTTINAEGYCGTLQRLRRAIQDKRRGMLTSGVVLIHDNARPHSAALTKRLLDGFKWDVFNHPAYSPDLAPSHYHLFPELKKMLGGQTFRTDDALRDAVKTHLKSLAANFYEEDIKKLVPRYEKCLNLNGDYVEK